LETFLNKISASAIKIGFIILIFLSGFNGFSQEDDDDLMLQDTIGFSMGKIILNNPNSILSAYVYDPVSDRYIFNSSFDDYNINYPLILTPKEYEELVQKESIRNYFKQKLDAMEGKKEGSQDEQRNLLPRYYVNSGLFEAIFGSNTIDVQPRGSVEMDLGVRHTKQDNPSFSPRNRSNTTFDFDQRISMSLTGKVGTRLNINANYDTQSTFAFQNIIKLEYTPDEDAILQKIEVGNVSLPLNNTLVRGAQSLFGVKAELQFGKTTVTGVFSEQKSQTRSVTAQGGGTLQDFEIFALDYDADRHFFLSQYFRNRYDTSLRNYPFIDSRVQITRIEVWITNRQNRVTTGQEGNNLRNIIALQDLGEARLIGIPDNQIVGLNPNAVFNSAIAPNTPSKNSNNFFDPALINSGSGLLNPAIREIVTASAGFNITVNEGIDYSKLENARKLTSSEFTYHPQLGYISLQQKLSNDEVLAVAYQYTIGDDVYQVGEFGNDGVESTIVDNGGIPITQSLILKMLKSNLTSVQKPVWNLMMKNIYQIPGAYQLEQEDFRFNILYTDPSPLNYITPAGSSTLPADVAETPLLKVFNVDRLNYNNDPQEGGDGFFDFVQGLTVDTQNGRIIFTTAEPFGSHLFNKLSTGAEQYDVPASYNENQAKYVFRTMYTGTQALALQESEKNKFQLKGRFKSMGGDGIPIGGFNIPRGSVVVSAGGRVLVEGVDYTVNYQLGRVRILDPSLQASGTPIEISVENNAVFGQQTRRFFGIHAEHKFSETFQVGATFLKMTERPFTQKSSFGQESVNNTIFGVNANYSAELPFLTRLANKLPFVDTDVPSNISLRGEVAFLKPDSPKADQFNGESTLYVDDFEGSQNTIDMKSPFAWSLSSVPERNEANSPYNFFGNANDLSYGYRRAKLSWYSIDPIFYTGQRPGGISDEDLATNRTRRVFIHELFPYTDIVQGQTTVINTLDLTYYPQERGPYNFNPNASGTNTLPDPEENFGGVMRAINSTNFEQSNVEYIQFWLLDPYVGAGATNATNQGKIYFNLGEISEDVLKDGRKMYENGMPGVGSSQPTIPTIWGKVPASQSLIYAFDTDNANRTAQDVGLDGLTDDEEALQFPQFAGLEDPAADNYQFYLNAQGDVLQRYKHYNGLQNNSPVDIADNNRGNSTLPDTEDINRDNTMNTINAYYEYSIDIRPGMSVGQNYITDIRTSTPSIPGPGNQTTDARWIQFKIPVELYERKIGEISDFRTIRFARMFLTGFSEELTVRFGTLELVRGEWRRYNGSLDYDISDNNDDDNTALDVLAVNVLENSSRSPINYVMPPGVEREQLYNQNTVVNQNEQSLSLRISKKNNNPSELGGLEPGDSRAVFKNIEMDFRQFKKLRMFLHAEQLPDPNTEGSLPMPEMAGLQDDEMIAFIRFGNDFTQNFYQVEIPLKVTPFSVNATPEQVWPKENEMELSLDLLTKLKILSLGPNAPIEDDLGIRFVDEVDLDPSMANKETAKLRLGIKGNPNFGLIRTLMIGLKNGTDNTEIHSSPRDIRGEVWFNELRVSDMNNKGGMAAVLNMDSNIADLASISAVGRMSTIGFGALEQGPNERSREDMTQYNIVTNINLGKMMPPKWGINLPFNYAIGEQSITPEYDPFYQDIRLEQLLDVTSDEAERENMRNRAIDYTKTRSINFIGVRKERGAEQKPRVYDVENLTLSHSYNKVERHNYEIESYVDQQTNTSADYAYTFQNKPVEPLKNVGFMKKSQYWKLLSDFNFNYLPSNINFSSNIIRQFNRQQFRQVEVQGIGIDPLFQRNYLFNYQYGFNFNLTKSLKINYSASTNNIVRNYMDAEMNPDNTNTIWDDYWAVGDPNQHNQQLVINYELPLNKLPFLSFLKTNYTYTGSYNWQRASLALSSVETEDGSIYNLGNTVQNSGSHRINAALNMDLFYKYIGLTKSSKRPTQQPRSTPPRPGERIENTRQNQTSEGSVFLDGLIGVVTSVKNIQVNYTHNTGTVLPGYLPMIGFFGSSKPSLEFVMGAQDEIRYIAAKNGWLTNYQDFNQNFTQVTNKQLNVTAKVDLFPDLTIDLVADRNYMDNFSEQFDVSDGIYNSRSPYNFGNFSISTSMIKTAFQKSDENSSPAFEQFRANRLEIANRLAENYYGTTDFPTIDDPSNPNFGYPQGFGKNNQAVLIPAFLSAYSGKDVADVSLGIFRDVPIPNWTLKYSGLMRYKFFKDRFRRFSIQHGYRASYTVNSFRSNFEYDMNPNMADQSGNFYNKTLVSNINLVEQFNPLIRLDMEMQNSFKILAEMKTDRALSLSFDNNLLTEQKGVEYTLGLGYRFKDVTITSSLADNPTGVIKSDINVRIDASFRDNKTIVRYLDYDNNQLAGGQNIWSAKLTADYAFSKQLTMIFFYDHMFSKAVISTAFPMTNIRTGFTLRYNFGN
jgi:cell surface protein SprA